MAEDNYISIAGTVKAVIFQNEMNGYTVLRAEDDSGAEFTAVGCLPFAAPGEHMVLTGEWTRHASHGEQFKAEWAERYMPSDPSAIYDYLASRVIKGVGPATAGLIVDSFGEKTLDVIENEPEKLVGIRGISLKRAKEMSENLRRHTGLRRLMEFLSSHGLRTQLAMRLYKIYGNNALEQLCDDPYILCAEQIGGTFSEADTLALELGFDGDSKRRVEAAAVFELRHNANNGHAFIPRDKLAAATAALIDVSADIAEESIDSLQESGELICERVAERDACYLMRTYFAETSVAERIRYMAGAKFDKLPNIDGIIEKIESEQGITYAPMQRKTLETAASRQIMVLTGGPGTGKTTCVRAVLAMFDSMGLDTVLTAPTGRAAKRMGELTGREAVTVHRLLEAGYSEDGNLVFNRNESSKLPCTAVILDESSMVDITLMSALLAAMPASCRLVMVGDADQLPSVGPGNVFLDVIRSGIVETVRLTDIFRQTEYSRIVLNAHRINAGQQLPLTENTGDFFFLRRMQPQRVVETIVELCSTRLPERMGIAPMDIQVLTPTRRRETGTVNLNIRLQEALNPPQKGKKEKLFGDIVFREGDRVMQIRNNYDIIWRMFPKTDADSHEEIRPIKTGAGVFNGDIGRIIDIDDAEQTVRVDFDGRIAEYGFDMLMELEHAYAMTVHKSQGSEYKTVVLAVSQGAPMLLNRSVLYTAVTRAREILIIVGDDGVIGTMIENHRQTRRYSGLRFRLAEGM